MKTTSYGADGRLAQHGGDRLGQHVGPAEADGRRVARDEGGRTTVLLDERHHAGPAGPGLQADGAGAGVQVEEAEAVERAAPRLDGGEERLAHPVAGRARLRAPRCRQPASAGTAPDDPRHDFSRNPEALERSISCTAAARSGVEARSGSAASSDSAASRARSIVAASRSTRRLTRLERKPDWLAPSTSPSRRCSRSIAAELEAVGGRGHGVEPLAGGRARLGARDQQAQAGQAAPADPAAQLVELGDAEPVGVEEHHRGGVVDVDADLDDRGGDEDVDLAGREGPHGAVLVVGGQPAVEHGDPQPGERSGGELGVHVLDGGERLLGGDDLAVLVDVELVAARPPPGCRR